MSSVVMQRYSLLKRLQHGNESMEEYMNGLRILCRKCHVVSLTVETFEW